MAAFGPCVFEPPPAVGAAPPDELEAWRCGAEEVETWAGAASGVAEGLANG